MPEMPLFSIRVACLAGETSLAIVIDAHAPFGEAKVRLVLFDPDGIPTGFKAEL